MSTLTKFKSVVLFGAVALAMNACSSSQVDESASGDAVPPVTDAATDAVPQPNPEAPAPTAPDQAAAPAPDAAVAAAQPAPVASAVPDAATPPAVTPPAADPMAAAAQPATPPAADPAAAAPAAPVDTAQNTPPAAAQAGGDSQDYAVQEGDTLMKIAFENYGDLYKWKDIYEANKDKLSSPAGLSKGMVLKIEKPSSAVEISRNGEKYLIKGGDTLGTISNDVYGTQQKWKRLWENNKQLIKNPNRIFAGFYLYYTMTPEDKQEMEQLKQQPMAKSAEPETTSMAASTSSPATNERAPASTTQQQTTTPDNTTTTAPAAVQPTAQQQPAAVNGGVSAPITTTNAANSANSMMPNMSQTH